MAVLSTLPGIEAHILINGKPSQTYPDLDEIQVEHPDSLVAEHQAARTVACWVESVTDQNFSVHLRVGPPAGFKQDGKKKMQYTKIGFHVFVDGVKVASAWCPRPWFKEHPAGAVWEQTIEGVIEEGARIRSYDLRKFRFAKISTDDSIGGKQVKETIKRMQKIGVIEVRVFSEDYGRSGGGPQGTSEGFLEDEEAVPEKALKGDAKSHGTALDDAQKTKRGKVYRTNKKDGEDYPLVIFRFQYRDGEALKKLHIIPRTPTPEPSPSPTPSRSPSPEVGDDGLTDAQREEMEEMRKKLAAGNKKGGASKRKESIKIKKERLEQSKRDASVAKRRKMGKASKKIEIDLTAENSDDEDDD